MKTNSLKYILLMCTMSIFCLHTYSQAWEMPKRYTGKKHRGFYLSMAMGMNNTNTKVDSENFGYTKYKGLGSGGDIKIGGTIMENLILHASIIGHSVTGPKVEVDDWGGADVKTDNKIDFGESLVGVGLTYYTMDNFLFSSSIGVGGFTLVNEREDIDVSTDPGFSFQLKVGKEWWVSPKWAFGVSAYYLSTNSLNLKGDVAEERIISSNLGILISATLNGRR